MARAALGWPRCWRLAAVALLAACVGGAAGAPAWEGGLPTGVAAASGQVLLESFSAASREEADPQEESSVAEEGEKAQAAGKAGEASVASGGDAGEGGGDDSPDGEDSPLMKACTIGYQKKELEVLAQLRACSQALEEFAKKTQSGHDESKKQNELYAKQFKEVLALLSKLEDYKSMDKAFSSDQKEAMDFLTKEASKAETEIKELPDKGTAGGAGVADGKSSSDDKGSSSDDDKSSSSDDKSPSGKGS
mmetsp:Transcript_158717/g.485889  ORF Transcript_158717/g.485889 Transcript_158717/m.485889 type:complete len:249 (+) Transcript_158717:92-838(+)